jgi:hypothetical protein
MSRTLVLKDDGTAKTSSNLSYRVQDQVLVDINGTNYSSSSTPTAMAGNHVVSLANTGGGTKQGPNIIPVQAFWSTIKGHGGSLTVLQATGVTSSGEIRTQAGDTTLFTNVNAFQANIPSTPETGGTATITNYRGVQINGNFNANLAVTNYTGVDIGGPGNPGGSYVAPTSIKGININGLAPTNNYNTWSIYDNDDMAKSKIGWLTIGYDDSDSTGEYRIKPKNNYGRDFHIRPESGQSLVFSGQKWPQSSGSNGQVLTSDGTNTYWNTLPNTAAFTYNNTYGYYAANSSISFGDNTVVGAQGAGDNGGISFRPGKASNNAYITLMPARTDSTGAPSSNSSANVIAWALTSSENTIQDLYEYAGNSNWVYIYPFNGNVSSITLTNSTKVLYGISAMQNGNYGKYLAPIRRTLIIKQDGTGGRTMSFSPKIPDFSGIFGSNATVKWKDGINTLSTAANAVDILEIFFDGVDTYYMDLKKGYA